jgi:hypothetical protein
VQHLRAVVQRTLCRHRRKGDRDAATLTNVAQDAG